MTIVVADNSHRSGTRFSHGYPVRLLVVAARGIVLSVLAFLLLTPEVKASLLVDQAFLPGTYPATGGYGGINLDNSTFVTSHIGQSFIPTLTSLNTVSFFLKDGRPSNDLGGVFFVELVSTKDLTTVLASSATTSIENGFGLAQPLVGAEVQFTFVSPVSLTPGQSYAIQLRKVSGDRFYVQGQSPGGYANGSYLNVEPADLYFSEGLLQTEEPLQAVPEPSGFALLGIGLVLTGLACRRRQQRD